MGPGKASDLGCATQLGGCQKALFELRPVRSLNTSFFVGLFMFEILVYLRWREAGRKTISHLPATVLALGDSPG